MPMSVRRGVRLFLIMLLLLVLPGAFAYGEYKSGEIFGDPVLEMSDNWDYSKMKPAIHLDAAAAERIRKAEELSWVGGNLVLVDGELINVVNNATVLKHVAQMVPWEEDVLVRTEDSFVFTVDQSGRVTQGPFPPDNTFPNCWLYAQDGVAIFSQQQQFLNDQPAQFTLWSRKYQEGRTIQSPLEYYEIFRDEDSGDHFLVVKDNNHTAVYRENGEVVWESDHTIVHNAYWKLITNGRLTGYRSDGKAVILDALTGEEITVLGSGWRWRQWDMQHQIFEDHTALVDYCPEELWKAEKSAVISLDGEWLIISDLFASDRHADGFYRFHNRMEETYGSAYCWDMTRGRIVHEIYNQEGGIASSKDLLLSELPSEIQCSRMIIDRKAKEWFPFVESKVVIISSDESVQIIDKESGSLFCNLVWQALWGRGDSFGVGHSDGQLFTLMGWMTVRYDHRWGVIGLKGELILPFIYEKISLADLNQRMKDPCYLDWPHMDTSLIAKGDDEVDFYDSDFQLMISTRFAE